MYCTFQQEPDLGLWDISTISFTKIAWGGLTCITPNTVRSKRALLLWELPTEILNRYLSFLKHLDFEVIQETVGKVVKHERRAEKLGYRYDEEYIAGLTSINSKWVRKIPCPPMNILNRLESECGDGQSPMSSIRLH